VRFDAMFPFVGMGGFFAPTASYSREFWASGLEARWAGARGHGGVARGTWGVTAFGSGYGADIGYLYRAGVTGDRDVSLAFDSMIGPTLAVLEHDEDTLPLGPHLGAHASFSLDLRVRNFLVGLGVQYRLLVPTRDAINGGPSGPEHVLTATVGLGFTIY
jgi:hypothetical protein